jgi:hypothetical protein
MWRDPPSLKESRRPDGPGAEWEGAGTTPADGAYGAPPAPTPTRRPPSASSVCRRSVRNPPVAEIVEPVG